MMLAGLSRRDEDPAIEGSRFKKELLDKGYSPEEIDHATSWAAERFKPNRGDSIRVLSPFERAQLTTDGCGLLLKLRNLGLLTDEHLELIIARAILLGESPIDAEGIRAMASVFLFDLKNQEQGFSLYIDSEASDVEN